MNKQERKKYDKQYYLKNKNKKIKYQKEYYLNNKDKVIKYYLENKEHLRQKGKEYSKQYRLSHNEEVKKYYSKWIKEQRKNNPNFRLKSNLRKRVWSALKGINKSSSTMELIGCSIDKLWNHLESKFESWMTKENYGLWHVDHKIACAKFDLTCPEQQRICFNYKNLQPMEATENMRKGAR